MTTNQHYIAEGNIVEWHEQPSGITTGIIANVPPVRRIGRVNHFRPSRPDQPDTAVVYDPDGIRCIVAVETLTVIAEYPEAGWSRL